MEETKVEVLSSEAILNLLQGMLKENQVPLDILKYIEGYGEARAREVLSTPQRYNEGLCKSTLHDCFDKLNYLKISLDVLSCEAGMLKELMEDEYFDCEEG